MVDRSKNAVNSGLAAKGMTEVPSGGDVEVSAVEVTKNRETQNTLYDVFGGRRFGGFGYATTTTDTYKSGTLLVNLFNAKAEKLICRGASSVTVLNKTDKKTKNPKK